MIRGQFDIVLAVLVALCLLLGGASAAGFLGNFLLQFLAIGLIIFGIIAMRGNKNMAPQPALAWVAGLFVLIALLQFIPLAPGLWSSLPGHQFIANGFEILGIDPPWLPLSLAAYNSLASLMWLLPALGVMFFASRLLDLRAEIVAAVICTIAVISIPIAGMQVIGGGANEWYFYTRSGFGQGTGFFANGNHQATFLLIALPMLSALFATMRTRLTAGSAALRLFFAGIALVLIIGIVLTGSMAGIGLLLVVIPASLFLIRNQAQLPSLPILAGAVLAGIVAVLALTNLGITQAGTALEASGPMSRSDINAQTLKAVWEFFPTGSGIGTFGDIYRMFEAPEGVTATFINHAHNDYLEIALETGLLGIITTALFIIWFVRRALVLWTSDRQNYFALAATIAIGVTLVHSMVDYPLRTAAISVLFGLSTALMMRPTALWSDRNKSRTRRASKTKIKL